MFQRSQLEKMLKVKDRFNLVKNLYLIIIIIY